MSWMHPKLDVPASIVVHRRSPSSSWDLIGWTVSVRVNGCGCDRDHGHGLGYLVVVDDSRSTFYMQLT
jgi:hypothetical protein